MCSFSLNMAVFATILLCQNPFSVPEVANSPLFPYLWLEKGSVASYAVDHTKCSLWIHNCDI